ncbi:hypothetical protein M404DRAFT_533935 [Pisolithus tinctorius Marx 270]|uniref:Uncharacterized protein n=1 Tax=Pisolithus tinctorius Marx 270 TaxID=870435 RepID=A0A0C3PB06_PISTI|nr:hypothetical protein M404DRAFT_533935 [Pisolithus tinctorius Marx 270]
MARSIADLCRSLFDFTLGGTGFQSIGTVSRKLGCVMATLKYISCWSVTDAISSANGQTLT